MSIMVVFGSAALVALALLVALLFAVLLLDSEPPVPDDPSDEEAVDETLAFHGARFC
ncbi:hypothetical protein ACQEU5_18275 [Marinactinospora thermotolerans]|uniref:Uncharacterized protein n=1 Tax=Marinactinospora thermotolerans DSM 45154 TaxID=1122192 RepID=A0A1T4TDW8_9ACTN|nr:hypothetical protein [Marinactinospora thermotolerans]SKA38399.1 hypothetical protein SAMN02745673_04816 [Marinactinospora thermotolerans DSM 45154]